MRLDPASTPLEIERRSFEIIESEIPEPRKYSGQLWEVARRCIHACGDIGILEDLHLEEEGLHNGLETLKNACTIYTDTEMLKAALVARRMNKLGVKIHSLMAIPEIEHFAEKWNCTRSRAGIKLIAAKLAGNIIAIGNAPTALLSLLEELRDLSKYSGPALIVGMPVGFVNAAQSKELLCASNWPKFVLRGRKGGSAIAGAAINALADLALKYKG